MINDVRKAANKKFLELWPRYEDLSMDSSILNSILKAKIQATRETLASVVQRKWLCAALEVSDIISDSILYITQSPQTDNSRNPADLRMLLLPTTFIPCLFANVLAKDFSRDEYGRNTALFQKIIAWLTGYIGESACCVDFYFPLDVFFHDDNFSMGNANNYTAGVRKAEESIFSTFTYKRGPSEREQKIHTLNGTNNCVDIGMDKLMSVCDNIRIIENKHINAMFTSDQFGYHAAAFVVVTTKSKSIPIGKQLIKLADEAFEYFSRFIVAAKALEVATYCENDDIESKHGEMVYTYKYAYQGLPGVYFDQLEPGRSILPFATYVILADRNINNISSIGGEVFHQNDNQHILPNNFCKLMSVLNDGKRKDEFQHIFNAMDWALKSEATHVEVDSAILRWIAIEALLGDKSSKSDVVKTLAIKYAMLTCKSFKDRDSAIAKFKKQYDIRSRLLHGSTTKLDSNKDDSFDIFYEALTEELLFILTNYSN